MGVDNPLSDWVPESVWGSVQALRELEDYANLPDDLVGSAKRWREWMELERPGAWDAVCWCLQLQVSTPRPDREARPAAVQQLVWL